MEYKIMVISTPECKYNKHIFTEIREFEDGDSIIINKIKNLGTIDLRQIFHAIYRGFNGIIIIIKGKIKGDKIISSYISFQKYVNEANRILEKRGFGNQRVSICYWDCRNYKQLIENFESAFKKIKKCGLNPTKIKKIYKFKEITPKKLMYSLYNALNNFHFRSLFKMREDILKHGKYNKEELNFILDSILEAETVRKYILQELKGKKPLILDEILKIFNFSKENIIKNLFYLKEQGYIEQIVDSETEIIKYKINEKSDEIRENYFESALIIQDKGICCHCGLCSSICPLDAIELVKKDLYIDEGTCITCGLCYEVCPKSFSFENIYECINKLKASLNYSETLGFYKNIFSARTLVNGIKEKGQDGGVVTSLLYYLLDQTLVDAVITIKRSRNFWKPKINLTKNKKDLYKTAGSIYAHFPLLSILNKIKKFENVAIVALPCKIKALTKDQLFPILPFFKNIKYKIGLFCIEAFSYESMFNLIEDKFNVDLKEIVKMDIKKGHFIVTLDSGDILYTPLKECHIYSSEFCRYCNDLTAKFADISIGSIGSKDGWSSVITRTNKGKDLLNGAIKQGLIEIKNVKDAKPCQFSIEKIAEKKKESCMPIEPHFIQHFC